jgi:hypothetical protein
MQFRHKRYVPIVSCRRAWLLIVGIAIVTLPAIYGVALGDDVRQALSNAGDAAQLPRRISLRFIPNSAAANAVAEDALRAKADEIADSANLDEGGGGERVIELRKNVTLWLNDGSVKAMADEAVITRKYRDESKTSVESFDVKLSGNVRWKSRQIAAWADELAVSLQPRTLGDRAAPRFGELVLTGRSRFVCDEFKGKADRINVDFVQQHEPPDQSMRLTLDGAATIVLGRPDDKSRPAFHARYIEFIPESNDLLISGTEKVGQKRAR